MTFGELPDDPSRRRVVVALDQAEFDALQTGDLRELATRTDLAIVDVTTAQASSAGLAHRLAARRLLAPGNTLLQSPFDDNAYELIQDAEDNFALDKFFALSHTCQLLGAKSLSIKSVEDRVSDRKWDAKGAATILKKFRITGTASGGRVQEFVRKLDISDEFSGGDADVDAAADHLVSRNLDSDRDLWSLVQARGVKGNPFTRRELTVDLSNESRRNLDLALNIPIKEITSASASFERARSERTHYVTRFEVCF